MPLNAEDTKTDVYFHVKVHHALLFFKFLRKLATHCNHFQSALYFYPKVAFKKKKSVGIWGLCFRTVTCVNKLKLRYNKINIE